MSPIPAPVQTVLDLFATEFADVHFGDLDAHALARLAADVQSAAGVVTAAEASLEAARAALKDRRDTLLQHAQRALAYARVYAENDPALALRLEAIALPRPTRDPQRAPRLKGAARKERTARTAVDAVAAE